MNGLEEIFGRSHPIIAMVHVPGLPGRPRQRASVSELVDRVGKDIAALQAGGVDGLLFCNEHDLPYQLDVGPEITAAMAAVVGEVHRDLTVPFGINILWDAKASLAVARATGASFIREVLTGVYESDLGMIEPHIGDLCGYRVAIGAGNVALFDNISPEFSSPVGARGVGDRARGAEFLGMDAILISGPAAGMATDDAALREAKVSVSHTPVIANTGVRAETIADILRVADAVIVGTSLKREGVTWNEVEPERVRELIDAAEPVRAGQNPAA